MECVVSLGCQGARKSDQIVSRLPPPHLPPLKGNGLGHAEFSAGILIKGAEQQRREGGFHADFHTARMGVGGTGTHKVKWETRKQQRADSGRGW